MKEEWKQDKAKEGFYINVQVSAVVYKDFEVLYVKISLLKE